MIKKRLAILFLCLILFAGLNLNLISQIANYKNNITRDLANIKKSDISFTRSPKDLSLYNTYNASIIAWGFLPKQLNDSTLKDWRDTVKVSQANGAKFIARVEFDAGWKKMIDFDPTGFSDDIVINLSGQEILYPWFSARSHKNNPAYYFCSNSPSFQEFIKYQIDLALSAKPEMIMLDAQTATPLAAKYYGGCFCDHCEKGFKKFLEKNYNTGELFEKGINNIINFDYSEFLTEKGWTSKQYKIESWNSYPQYPLSDDYREYQWESLQNLIISCEDYVDQKAEYEVKFGISNPVGNPFRSVILPEIDFYCAELAQEGYLHEFSTNPITTYKFIESLDLPLVLTGEPANDWYTIHTNKLIPLVKIWIAQAYANGAVFIVPVKQWWYNTKNSTDGYCYGSASDFEYLYRFINENANLFDNYTILSRVAFLLPYKAYGDGGPEKTNQTVEHLVLNNIPFEIVTAGNDWWKTTIDKEILKRTDAIIINDDYKYITCKQNSVLNDYSLKIVDYKKLDDLFKLIPRQINVSIGNEKVSVFPRENNQDSNSPYVIHLVNRSYSYELNKIEVQTDFTITFNNVLFNKSVSSAMLLRPKHDPIELKMNFSDDGFNITVPSLEEWGILKLVTS